MIADVGAEAFLVDAADHDRAIALTSHMPQILSTALASYLSDHDVAKFAGTGLATFLRLAASDASVWTPTIEANRRNIQPHVEPIIEIIRAILNGDAEAFKRAQAFMKKLTADS